MQEFRRPEFEVGAQASPGPHFVGGEALVTVRAAYFAGGVAARRAGHVERPLDAGAVHAARAATTSRSARGCRGGGRGTRAAATRTETFESRTDAAGQHHLKIAFERVDPPQASQVEAEASVMDVNRQAWTSTARLLVHPADVYVGLRAPRLFVQPGERLFVESIVVDLDGRAVPGRPVTATLERMAWEQVAGEWKEVPAGPRGVPARPPARSRRAAGSCPTKAAATA